MSAIDYASYMPEHGSISEQRQLQQQIDAYAGVEARQTQCNGEVPVFPLSLVGRIT